jgi:alpha-glucosidase
MLPEVHDVLRRMRAMADTYSSSAYPNTRVLIGETYLPNTAALLPWYGTPAHPELELPMDMLVGFHAEGGVSGANASLNATHFRETLNAAETEINSHQPLLVFDNHDNPRSWDRFGDGVHNLAIAKIIASMLLTTRATPLMYYGEEIGMVTSTPTGREDVKDPIGITGWPKEKGRDGERTPMQWDASKAEAGFSTNAHTWLPVPPDYTSVNVASESADPNSLLNWYENLIRLRREVPALRDGSMRKLDCHNAAVVCYVRKSSNNSAATVVALNMSGSSQTATIDLAAEGVTAQDVRTLLTDEPELSGAQHLASMTLAPFASWIGSVN